MDASAFRAADDRAAAHVRDEDLRDADGAVLALVVLDDGDERPSEGDGGGVVRVRELRAAGPTFHARAEAARLIVGHEVGGVRLAVSALSRHPRLDVDLAR